MALVNVDERQKFVRSTKGVRLFKFEMGKIYHMVFLGREVEKDEEGESIFEPILFVNPVHTIKKDGKSLQVRCANQNKNLSNVVLTNEEGELLKDPKTGRVLNDGKCPYCELRNLYLDWRNKKVQEWEEKNPNASKKERRELFDKLKEKEPVSKIDQQNVIFAAIFELDNNKIPEDSEGKKLYNIQGVKMSDYMFNDKFLPAVEIKRMEIENPNDKGIAWHEYYFKYPKKDNKRDAGRDVSISPANKKILEKDPDLFEELKEEVEKLDLDAIENQIFQFRLKSLDEMERDIEPQMSVMREEMSDEDLEKAKEKLGEEKTATDDDIKNIAGVEEESDESDDSKESEGKEKMKEDESEEEELEEEVSGEDAFDTGIDDEEIDELVN